MTHPSNTSVTAQFGAGERGECLNCGRHFSEHSFNTRDICNFFIGGGDDVRRTVPNSEGDTRGTGQGGMVSGDAAGQKDLRTVAQSAAPVSHTSVKDGGGYIDPDGINGCMMVAAKALDFLANHDRPIGGSQEYNAEHLMQLASELRRTSAAIASAPAKPSTGSDAVADGAREIAADIEELLSVIEAVRGDRGVLRVSGTRGDSQDVGVLGVKPFSDLMRRAIAALRAAPVKAEIKPHRYIPDYEAANGDCAVCGHRLHEDLAC
jgi:hypothetical protein